MQTTIAHPIAFSGIGLHSGRTSRIKLRPASADVGVVFHRMDVPAPDRVIAAVWDNVEVSPLNTRLVNAAGVSVSTIEHLMAALMGCGVHNVHVEITGPELPILDGSAAKFVRGLMDVGLKHLDAPLRVIEVLKPVRVEKDGAVASLFPSALPEMEFTIEFADAAIGRQHKRLSLANGNFVRELCDSRTFCRQKDVEAMHAQGLALGGSLENAVVVDGSDVLSPGGLRHADEAVRHKMLDALGDLGTAGAPILGRYVGERAGHAMTNHLLRALFADRSNWTWRTCDSRLANRLPGAGLVRADLAEVA